MATKRFVMSLMVSLVFTAISLNAAYAFCDVLRYTAADVSAKESILSANNVLGPCRAMRQYCDRG